MFITVNISKTKKYKQKVNMETLVAPQPDLGKKEIEKKSDASDANFHYGNSGFMGWFKRSKENKRLQSSEASQEGSLERSISEERLFKIIEDFDQNHKRDKELSIQSREAILSDSTHIENQEVSFIDQRERGHLGVSLKLTQQQFEKLIPSLQAAYEKSGDSQSDGSDDVTSDKILYESLDGKDSFTVCEAYKVNYKGMTIKIANPAKSGMTGEYAQRASIGLVCIEIPYDKKSGKHLRDVEETLSDIMINVLGVPEGLSTPTSEAERQYKEFRYRWHHKLPEGPMNAEQSQESESLERREVFPGYHTMVSEGKHKEYEKKYGDFVSFHEVRSTNVLEKMIKGYGLMSSHERFRRGMLLHGTSSSEDFNTGGADSVFVRTYVENAVDNDRSSKDISMNATLVFDPKIFDRTDWYSYPCDQFGRTSEEIFKDRQSPEELFGKQKDPDHGYIRSNEQMFRTGITFEHIKAVASSESEYAKKMAADALGKTDEEIDSLWKAGPNAVRNAIENEKSLDGDRKKSLLFEVGTDNRFRLIDDLRKKGIKEIKGKPVEEFIVAIKSLDDLVDIAHDREPRSNIKDTQPEEPQEAKEEPPEKVSEKNIDEDVLENPHYNPYQITDLYPYHDYDFLEDDLFDHNYNHSLHDIKKPEGKI